MTKFNVLLLFLFGALSLSANNTTEGTLTSEERTFLINYLDETEQYLLHMLEEVDSKAWNYRIEADKWTIGECAEHILKTEQGILKTILEKAKSENPDRTKKSAISENDQIIQIVNDRITKQLKTIEKLEPSGDLNSKDAFVQAISVSRKKVKELISETELPLHWHYVQSPLGEIDLYQYLLICAAHASRHTQQIEEIKTSLNLETTTIEFGGRTKINIAKSERENTHRLFGDILHLEIEKGEAIDRIHFDGGGFVALVYQEDVSKILPEAFQLNAMWAGLRIPSYQYESVKRRLKAFGVKELYPDKDQSKHFYFHAPGGQVYRLEKMMESKT